MRRCVQVVLCAGAWVGCAVAQQTWPPASAPAGRAGMSVSEMLAEAERLVGEKRYEQAQPLVTTILAEDKSNLLALSLSGEIYENLNQREAARAAYNAAREIQPNDFRANLGLGRLYVGSNFGRQALHYLEIAEPVCPPERKSELYLLMARAQRAAGSATKALEAIQKAIEADRSNYQAWQYATLLLTEAEDFDRALVATQQLARLAEIELARDLGNVEALQRLNTAYEARLSVLRAYHQRLYERNVDGSYSDRLIPGTEKSAAAMLQAVIETMVLQAELRRTYAYHQAIPLAEKMVQYDPDNAANWMQLALLYVNTAQNARAAETLRKVLELEPDNAQAREQLERLSAAPAPTSAPAGRTP